MKDVIKFLEDEITMTKNIYLEAENKLIDSVKDYIVGINISNNVHGEGQVVSYSGTTMDNLIIDIKFPTCNKRFSLLAIINLSRSATSFTKVTDEETLACLVKALEIHTQLLESYKAYEIRARQLEAEAQKKALAEKKAEEKRQRQKEQAIKSFEAMQNRTYESTSDTDDFYYALGWLAKHAGTVSATIPDYLESAFNRCFGSEVEPKVVDSRRKTSGGYSMQWSWSFKIGLKKNDAEELPLVLRQYASTTGKAIANTTFIWDLIKEFNFKFGKAQDVEKIRESISAQYISSFDKGFGA